MKLIERIKAQVNQLRCKMKDKLRVVMKIECRANKERGGGVR